MTFYYIAESSNASIGQSLRNCELTSKCFYQISQRVKSAYFNSLKIPLEILGEQKATDFIQRYEFSDFDCLESTLLQTPSGLELAVKGDLKIDLFSLSGLTELNKLELSDVTGDLPNLQNCEKLEKLTIAGETLTDSAHNFARVPFANLVELSIKKVGFVPEIENIDFPNLKKLTLRQVGSFVKVITPLDISKFPNIEFIDFKAGINAVLDFDSFRHSLLHMEMLKKATFDIHCPITEKIFLHYKFNFKRD